MRLTPSPTERTTAATDLILCAQGLLHAADLLRGPGDPWRGRVWAGAFAGLGVAGALGAVAHGLELGEAPLRRTWRGIYLALGLTVACFAAGAVGDAWGRPAGRRAVPALGAAALGFFALSQRLRGGFLVFIVYEAAALLFALGVYARLAQGGRLAGAHLVAAGTLVSLIAAAVQTSRLRVTLLGLPLDNNGLFHLVQMAGLPILAAGLRAGQRSLD